MRRLLAAQFPQWAELPIAAVASSGTDNALYRLGDDKVVRLPRIDWAVDAVDREQRWLPKLAPLLPVKIPAPLGRGAPGGGFPWPWSIYGWLEGENPKAGVDRAGDASADARLPIELVHFIRALHRIDAAGGPPAGVRGTRGVPLAERDAPTRAAIQALRGKIDGDAVSACWERALAAPAWNHAPVWIHADLAPGNLLCVNGRLNAVLDFGLLGVGDPAVDLILAWNLLMPRTRVDFRNAVGLDDATWERGRGWALSIALIQLPYYEHTNRALAANARYTIGQVLSDGSG
ncbi:MAG TPA: aminoglycoside phosphotransferase family protein [Myxococcota bacterium]|nr:aminoglycoside phosphotransferase family protein [Myxococcota bacterium]